jgi:hypothetical protein
MKNTSFGNIFPNPALSTRHYALSTLFEKLHFSCAIISPESKILPRAHQNCTGALVNRPACRARKSLSAPKRHHISKQAPGPSFPFCQNEKTEPFLNQFSTRLLVHFLKFVQFVPEYLTHFNTRIKTEPKLNHFSTVYF